MTRARYPDHEGQVDRDGVKIHYEVYDGPGPTIMLLPTWSLFHSRHWKMQIPYLARHFRVVTMDGRGNGKSDRPTGIADHADKQYLSDIVAVLDETSTSKAVVAGLSYGGRLAALMAGLHPDRVIGGICVGPSTGITEGHPNRTEYDYLEELDTTEGWAKNNAHFIRGHHREFVEFFVGEIFSEPHSTKPVEDGVRWAMETDAETLIVTSVAEGVSGEEAAEIYRSITCPMLVLVGTDDRILPPAEGMELAKLCGAELIQLTGSGHAPNLRDPVKVNHLITDFVRRITGTPPPTHVWARGFSRRKRVLYISSPIGLGHARRDVAIAEQLCEIAPEVEIDWLAQHPVTRVLDAAGLRIHPASDSLANESNHIESECGEHDLHCFQALRRMDEILLANFMVFQETVDSEHYDLVIADEAWDIDYYWHENPELKRCPHVWMTDFVGFLPMPDGGEHEEFLTADYNAEMIEHIDRYPWIRDQAIFVGNPDDIVPDRFGADLPVIREWTEENFEFSGYITGFEPPTADEIPAIREELGYHADEKICIVTVGGSGIGRDLIDRIVASHSLMKRNIPGLRMIVVAGPRIDTDTITVPDGVEVRAYVDQLHRHLSVCDLALVQGGLTTTMELAAARRPFLYFPLRNHFEQNFHVRQRLDRYGAGRCMDFATSDPDAIAAAAAEELTRPIDSHPVESDGAARAAQLIAQML